MAGDPPGASRTPIQVSAIQGAASRVGALLRENEADVIADGGEPLSDAAAAFIGEMVREIAVATLINRNFSIEDFALTPFARMDGTAYLLLDYKPVRKRLTVLVAYSADQAWVTATSQTASGALPPITAPGEIAMYLGWLTKPGE